MRHVNENRERTRLFAARGYHVIRFWYEDIFTNLEGVLEPVFAELGLSEPRF